MKRKHWMAMIAAVIAVVTLATVGAISFIHPASDEVNKTADEAFLNAFRSSEANFRELTVQCWGKIDTQFHDSASLNGIYEQLAAIVGGDNDLLREEYGDSFYTGITVKGYTGDGFYMEMMLQSISDGYEEDETFLIVNLSEKSESQELSRITAKCNEFFKTVEAEGETQILLSAYFEELLSPRQKRTVAERIFKDGGGEIIEGVDEDTYMSRSGIYPGLGDGVVSAGKKINLQVAMFDNEVNDETSIYLGTPLVFSEY